MTLVVGRVCGPRVAIAADTLVTEHKMRLPLHRGTIKSCMLPGGICVSFSNSPELANNSFRSFVQEYPNGTTPINVIEFFESASAGTGNDYLVAFSKPAKLIKITDGNRHSTLTDTVWIGDRGAYSRFREYSQRKRERPNAGRAINAVYFADEPTDSPASDLFSAMRSVTADHEIEGVGGFVSVVSGRDDGFRHSVYSDMLFDWPIGQPSGYGFRYEQPIALNSTSENEQFAVAQVSSGYLGSNALAFYLTRGKKLFLFRSPENLLPSECLVFSNVEPKNIPQTLNQSFGFNLRWLLTITSPGNHTDPRLLGGGLGAQLAFKCEASTFPVAE